MQLVAPSWFTQRLGRWCYRILTGLVISGVSVHTARAFDSAAVNLTGKIMFHNEQLTAKITATSLRQVMAEIHKVSGVQIRWLDAEGEEPVSVNFVAIPFAEAIQRLLGERNFLLFYSSTDGRARVTQVWISSGKARTTQLDTTQQPLARESSLLDETNAFVENFVSPDMLLHTALYDRGPTARLEAISRLKAYSHQDPRISAAFSHLAEHDDDFEVREAAAEALRGFE